MKTCWWDELNIAKKKIKSSYAFLLHSERTRSIVTVWSSVNRSKTLLRPIPILYLYNTVATVRLLQSSRKLSDGLKYIQIKTYIQHAIKKLLLNTTDTNQMIWKFSIFTILSFQCSYLSEYTLVSLSVECRNNAVCCDMHGMFQRKKYFLYSNNVVTVRSLS